ncbi:unnamed protein product [Agarophyton chilense]
MSSHTLKAENGRPGMSAKRKGGCGDDLIVNVPPGTIVRELLSLPKDFNLELVEDVDYSYENLLESEHEQPSSILVCELNQDGQRAEMVKGGCGGRGNIAFKSSRNRSPTNADIGERGQKKRLELELKTIADVGLVGFPNAGKNSVNWQDRRKFTVADIPGLIEGAHENRGLGHEFLRHIERTAFLVYVLDLSSDKGTAVLHFDILRNELEMHASGLSDRLGCIVANKMDAGEIAVANLTHLLEHVGNHMAIFPTSAWHQTGIEDVVKHISVSLPIKTSMLGK